MPVSLDFSKLTLMDALDLAILVEEEASQRYRFFVKSIGHRLTGDAASVFKFMAENEEKHGRQLNARRQELFGDTAMSVSKDALFDVEAPDITSPYWNMAPLKAFQVALSAEEKAYEFFDQALEHVTDTTVRELFLELRSEETEHVALIQKAIEALPPGSDEDLENLDD